MSTNFPAIPRTFPNNVWLIKAVKQKLVDLFLNEWQSQIENNRLFKTKFCFESYLVRLPAKSRKYLLKFRTRNHRLPIDTAQWRRIRIETRKCHLCHLDIGDEFHYMLTCSYLNNLRRQYIDRKFFVRPNFIKFSSLLNAINLATLRKLCLFIKGIFDSL